MKTKERLQIKLNDKYQITADSVQYILQEKATSESGKDYTNNIAYAGKIEHLLKCLLEREIKSSAITELKDLNEFINKKVEEVTRTIIRSV